MNTSLVQYIFYDVWIENECPLIRGYPMMSTPWPLLSITGLYLYFVKWLGPELMANRKPFDLRWPIRVFNTFMVCLNFWGLTQFMTRTNYGFGVWKCPQICTNVDTYYIYLGYIFFWSRIFEFMDTIFFVLRKKNRQVSNLHVFHHSVVPIAIWSVFKFVPSVENAMYPFINTIVHVIMYVYYTMASFGPLLEPYLKWKKYLTGLQLVQFIIIIVHSVRAPFIGCHMSSAYFLLISTILGGIFFYLFYSFYLDNYCNSCSNNSDNNNNNNSVLKNTVFCDKSTEHYDSCPDLSYTSVKSSRFRLMARTNRIRGLI